MSSKSKISFTSSFTDIKSGFLTSFARDHIKENANGFITSTKKKRAFQKNVDAMKPQFEFASDEVKKSKSLPRYSFTNFLRDTTQIEVKTSIYDVLRNPSIIDQPKGDEVRINERILECVKLYYSSANMETTIFKINMLDAAGLPKPVRVYCIAEFDASVPKAKYKIVLIDPFHLVIPSEHTDKKSGITKTKEEMQFEVYNANAANKLCMSDYVSSLY